MLMDIWMLILIFICLWVSAPYKQRTKRMSDIPIAIAIGILLAALIYHLVDCFTAIKFCPDCHQRMNIKYDADLDIAYLICSNKTCKFAIPAPVRLIQYKERVIDELSQM